MQSSSQIIHQQTSTQLFTGRMPILLANPVSKHRRERFRNIDQKILKMTQQSEYQQEDCSIFFSVITLTQRQTEGHTVSTAIIHCTAVDNDTNHQLDTTASNLTESQCNPVSTIQMTTIMPSMTTFNDNDKIYITPHYLLLR